MTDTGVPNPADEELDALEEDLDAVAEALEALDGDDLERAEELAAGLAPADDASADEPADEPTDDRAAGD